MTRDARNRSRDLHHAVDRTVRACERIRVRFATATAADPRPIVRPEVLVSARGPSDPTGRQVAAHQADIAACVLTFAQAVEEAGNLRLQVGAMARICDRVVQRLAVRQPDGRLEPADLSGLTQRWAIAAGCAVLEDTARRTRTWWTSSQQTDDDILTVAPLIPLSWDLDRLATRLRPHEHHPRHLAPTLRWCGCDDPTCERLTRPGQGTIHPTCRKRRQRARQQS